MPDPDKLAILENKLQSLHEKVTLLEEKNVQLESELEKAKAIEKELTNRFEKTHLLKDDLTLSPGAKAVFSEAIQNRIIIWTSIIGAVSLLGGGVYLQTSVKNAVDGEVKTHKEEIAKPIEDFYMSKLKDFDSELDRNRLKIAAGLNKINETLARASILQQEMDELDTETKQQVNAAQERFSEAINEALEEVREQKDDVILESKNIAENLAQEILKEKNGKENKLKKALLDALNQNTTDEITWLAQGSQWELLTQPVAEFDPICDYRAKVTYKNNIYSYNVSSIRKQMLTFQFEGDRYYRINAFNVTPELKINEWRGGTPRPDLFPKIYQRCLKPKA
ncbi:hypothetical protein SG34_030040 [Thalassomonas viridans]|uniref:Uncharacterized protein n=1 Tax=Thalassomonas viridans TaxID=137584 RepID=A0AAE9ZAZ2_9GAMM|nr:hypothetical protein [Thalassomonas viridans]WDE09020.1 hypothetical protein SG34_030040 [Thalassomonas viridans]